MWVPPTYLQEKYPTPRPSVVTSLNNQSRRNIPNHHDQLVRQYILIRTLSLNFGPVTCILQKIVNPFIG